MSAIHRPFAITSSRVVMPDGVHPATVLVEDGKIVGVSRDPNLSDHYHREDVGNLVVMPGLVDTHVHINEPGRTEWEGFESATKAAAAGGITTLVDMPLNSSPVTTTVDAFKKKLDAAQGKLHVDCGFHAGLIPGNTHEIQPLIDAGVLGVKAFLVHSGIDEFPNATETDLRLAMPIIAQNKMPLLVHAELASPVTELGSPRSYHSYLASRPRPWEQNAIALMIRLCTEFACRTHIVHLSSADAVPLVSQARQSGLPLTVETCPHYLFFSSEEIEDGDTRFKCAPPIREAGNRERLWEALRYGVISFIVSDHSPCPPEMKLPDSGDFQKAWGGIASLQFGLPIIWTYAQKRGFSYTNMVDWMSDRPARLCGLEGRKGALAPGYDADIVVWNPEEEFVVTPSMIFHRHKVTPYEGKTLRGKVKKTFLRGIKVFEDGSFVSPPTGQTILRKQP